jgi:hypothetical protein
LHGVSSGLFFGSGAIFHRAVPSRKQADSGPAPVAVS